MENGATTHLESVRRNVFVSLVPRLNLSCRLLHRSFSTPMKAFETVGENGIKIVFRICFPFDRSPSERRMFNLKSFSGIKTRGEGGRL